MDLFRQFHRGSRKGRLRMSATEVDEGGAEPLMAEQDLDQAEAVGQLMQDIDRRRKVGCWCK